MLAAPLNAGAVSIWSEVVQDGGTQRQEVRLRQTGPDGGFAIRARADPGARSTLRFCVRGAGWIAGAVHLDDRPSTGWTDPLARRRPAAAPGPALLGRTTGVVLGAEESRWWLGAGRGASGRPVGFLRLDVGRLRNLRLEGRTRAGPAETFGGAVLRTESGVPVVAEVEASVVEREGGAGERSRRVRLGLGGGTVPLGVVADVSRGDRPSRRLAAGVRGPLGRGGEAALRVEVRVRNGEKSSSARAQWAGRAGDASWQVDVRSDRDRVGRAGVALVLPVGRAGRAAWDLDLGPSDARALSCTLEARRGVRRWGAKAALRPGRGRAMELWGALPVPAGTLRMRGAWEQGRPARLRISWTSVP